MHHERRNLWKVCISGWQAQELERHLSESDSDADFDERFRIHDFFCYADTWKSGISELAKSSNVALMDELY